MRRPTTAAPLVCSWSDGAAPLIDRLGIPGRLRRRPVQGPDGDPQLRGLVLVDLPDHDSAAVEHREQVDRVLALVDAVIWVVDPEKYADAVLHERYLRPMAGHAEVMFLVLNQVDRLPGEAAEQVLDDLRRLLDEDGVALGEYGEPGATVLPVSALTGDGIGELREALGQFVSERGAPGRRVSADVDAAAARLRPVYTTGLRAGLSENARDEFAARLADAVGATAAGEAAERAWLRNANRACGTPWLRLWRWYQDRREPPTGRLPLRAPRTRRRRRGSGSSRRCGRWPTARRRACPPLGRRRCARPPCAARTDCRRRWTRWPCTPVRPRSPAASGLVAGGGAGPGFDDSAAGGRRPVAARADHRIHVAEPGRTGAADGTRDRRRTGGGVELPDGRAGAGATVRAGGGTQAAGGGRRVRTRPGAGPGGVRTAAVPGGAGAVREGHGSGGRGRCRCRGAGGGGWPREVNGRGRTSRRRGNYRGGFPPSSDGDIHSSAAVHSPQRERAGGGSLVPAALARGSEWPRQTPPRGRYPRVDPPFRRP